MTSRLMWYHPPSASFLLLLLLPFTPTWTEVVRSTSDCDQFFLNRSPPHVPDILEGGKILNQNRYKPICQTYRNQRRFVTLYDVKNKIPVFSAYKYVGDDKSRRPKKTWKIEPQLEKESADKNMMPADNKVTYTHQAVDTDFRSGGKYDRGHIFPSSHAFTEEDKKSTFTLTNIVPQAESFNKGSWNNMEICIKCVLEKFCVNSNNVTEGFVVTGAQPSPSILNNKVTVPSLLWSAFCCYSANAHTWIASAHWGDNVPESKSKGKHLETKTLADLYDKLKTAGSEFEVFPGTQCPLHTTVTRFYPEIQNCQCPPASTRSTSVSVISAPLALIICTLPFIFS